MYLEHYGLDDYPFHVTPDPRFLYHSVQHRRVLDHLRYGVEQRKGFIELIGEVGAGKTTLCRALLESLPDNVRTALILNPSVSETQLLRAILCDLGLRPKGRDRLSHIQQLNEFLLDQVRHGGNVVVIIDEAQDLDPEALEQVRLLNNLETNRYKLMQIILSGQPELKQRLNRQDLRQLRQRIMVRCRLNLLNRRETEAYIHHRMAIAGANGSAVFDPAAVRLVYKITGGTPRMINTLCDHALIAGYVAGKQTLGSREVKKALAEIGSMA